MNSNKASTSNILKFFKPNKRAVFFVLLAVLVLGFSSLECLAYTYTPDQINQLKNRDQNQLKVWSDTALGAVQKAYSWDELQKLQKQIYDYEIIKDAKDGLTYQQALDSNLQTRVAGTADLAAGVQNSGDNLGLKILFAPIIAVLFLIAYFLKTFVGLAGSLLDLTLRPELYNFTSSEMITQGWVIVRDVCNLLFLLVLLFIAICTILKIEKYHAKKTLLMLIIMALLINFSKPIAVFIFDGSQLLMNFFLSRMSNGNLTPSTMYSTANKIAEITYESIQKYSESDKMAGIAVQYLFAIVFLFMLLVAFLVIAIFLIIRIVVIMLLIIVSPFAFFASIIPDFNKLSSSWWNALFHYAYYGPAAAFFLYLATSLSQHLPKITGTLEGVPGNDPVMSKLLLNMISYLITIVFLYASIIMSKQFGLFAANAVVGNADKFMKWAGKGMAMAPYRATAWGARTSGITGGVKQAIGASRFGKYITKEGRKDAQEEREAGVAEGMGVTGAKNKYQLKKMAETSKKWKDEGVLDDEVELRRLSTSGSPLQKMTAARELAKGKKIKSAKEYNDLRNQFTNPTFRKIFEGDVKKNMPHIFFRHLMDNEGNSAKDAFEKISAGQSFEEFLKNTRVPALDTTLGGDAELYDQFKLSWNSLKPEAKQAALTRIPAPMVKFLADKGLI